MNHTKNGFPIWDEEFDREHFTPEEIAESDLRVTQMTGFAQMGKENKENMEKG